MEGLWFPVFNSQIVRVSSARRSDHAAAFRPACLETPPDVGGISDQAAILHAAILDNSGHAIIATDTDGLISVFNRAAERMLGYSASDVIGKLTPAPFHKAEEVAERARLFAAEIGIPLEPGFEVFVAKARLNLPNDHEWTYIRKDGSTLRVLLSVTALRNGSGELFGFLGMVVDVSENTAYRSVLEEREVQYRQLFQENPNAMLVYDMDSTHILAANEALLEMYGYQAGELTGVLLSDLWVADDRARLNEMIEALADDSNPAILNRRWRTQHRDGHEIVVETKSREQTLGEYRARLVLVQEVTDKVLTEKKVADQGRFLSSLLDALPVPVFYKDRAGRYLGGNPAYFALIGVTPETYIGKTVEDISPPELAKTYRAADEGVFAEPDVVQIYESQVRSANGDLRDVVFHKAAFRDHQGSVAGLIGILHDITQQRRVDKALRESEARLLQVLHNSPLPIFVVDQGQRVVLWNGACERVIGIPAAEILGTCDAWRAFYPERRPVLANLIVEGGDEGVVRGYYGSSCRRSPLNPDAFESEGFFPKMGDGSGRWLYFSASPLRNAEGDVIGAIETLVDISERKRAEAEARQLTDELEARVELRTQELERANEELRMAMSQLVQAEKLASLGTLVAGVAHELNTPLGNVRTVASTLQGRVATFARAVAENTLRRSMLDEFLASSLEASELIDRNAQRASDLIADFKQVAVDQTSTRRRQFDLSQVVHEIYATMRPRLRHSPHRLLLDIPPDIGMDSFPGPLEQVLLNFFNNSLMHAFDDDISGTISIKARQSGMRVDVDYSDNGCGMNAETVARAFDPFFTTRLGNGGSGLGLYIVFNLVTAVLGGEIRMQSEPGKGTTFHLRLPLVAPNQSVVEEPYR